VAILARDLDRALFGLSPDCRRTPRPSHPVISARPAARLLLTGCGNRLSVHQPAELLGERAWSPWVGSRGCSPRCRRGRTGYFFPASSQSHTALAAREATAAGRRVHRRGNWSASPNAKRRPAPAVQNAVTRTQGQATISQVPPWSRAWLRKTWSVLFSSASGARIALLSEALGPRNPGPGNPRYHAVHLQALVEVEQVGEVVTIFEVSAPCTRDRDCRAG